MLDFGLGVHDEGAVLHHQFSRLVGGHFSRPALVILTGYQRFLPEVMLAVVLVLIVFEQVKKLAEKDGLKIQIVEFSDYVQPNATLAAGDLDADSYSHRPASLCAICGIGQTTTWRGEVVPVDRRCSFRN